MASSSVNFSAFSIRRPIPAIVMFGVLMLMGLFSFKSISVTKFPNIDVPVVLVTVTQQGAAPAELETQVARKVEDAVAGIAGVKHIMSTLTDGNSATTIEFQLETNVDRSVNDVKDAIAKIRADLPRTIDEPIIQRIDVEGQAILSYAIASPGMTLEQLSWFGDDVVKRELQGLRAVGQVERYGGVTREIQVTLDPDRLMSLGVTASDVNKQVRSTSVDLAGGRGQIGGKEQSIRTLAAARTVEDLANTRIMLPGGREVRLSEIATVSDGFEEPRSFARLNGKDPVVTINVFRAKGASELVVKTNVEKKIAELRQRNPNVSFTLIDDAVAYTYGNFSSTMHTLVEGALLAVVVVFIFLRDWRATLVAAVALPLSIIPTFWAMEAIHFSLNLVSLLALTLVTGILVDDAIVEIENIVRHMRMGKSPYRAAMEAADEIGLAVIAITMTIVAVFAPVSFMPGIAGQYFKQFGLTVVIAVLFSLLVARLVTPMMAAYLMRNPNHKEHKDGFVMRAYMGFLRITLAHKRFRIPIWPLNKFRIPFNAAYLTLVTGVVLFSATIWATQFLPTGFIPPEDNGRIVLSFEMPPGVTVPDMMRKTDEAAAVIRQSPEVRQVYVIGGATAIGARDVRKATLVIQIGPKSERPRHQKALEGEITARLAAVPDLRVYKVNERGDRELSVSLLSSDPAALARAVGNLEGAMRRVPGFLNVAANAGLDRPEIRITPRFDEAARFGIATDQISDAVRVATIGDVGPNLAKFNAGDRLVPIRVQFQTQARGDLRFVQNMMIAGGTGATVPLASVADVDFGQGPASIDRYDRVRRVVVGADLGGVIPLGEAVQTSLSLPEAKNLPAGVRVQQSGDAEVMGEVFDGFAKAMVLGIMLVLGVLILLFGSVFQPITILLSLPLSIGGVVAALLITNNPVSMPVVIGILMLMGIVTKNAIMLVDFAVESEARGVKQQEAILDAGHKRARPIVMTTIAMAAGMLPTALGYGDGGEFRAPMAIAVIGGLLVSTVLSLIFVPSFFCVMDDLSRFIARFGRKLINPNEDMIAASHQSAHADAMNVLREANDRGQRIAQAAE
ncbi:efflux RND transporter permease subunit [Terrarubrum flagellatum]|uniref:efflux RND transporter permease subunit n=1 Tax=Terrirubrum flagellatum TaxID=2895980 RepID=UPI003144EC34